MSQMKTNDLLEGLLLSDATWAWIRQTNISVDSLFEELVDQDNYCEAMQVFPYTVPVRAALWWACQVLHHAKSDLKESVVGEAELGLRATLGWLSESTEANRRLAGQLADEIGASSPGGALALSVFHSGGSISLPEFPEVQPLPTTTPRLVAAVALLAAGNMKPSRSDREPMFEFLQLGLQLVDGSPKKWDAATDAPSSTEPHPETREQKVRQSVSAEESPVSNTKE